MSLHKYLNYHKRDLISLDKLLRNHVSKKNSEKYDSLKNILILSNDQVKGINFKGDKSLYNLIPFNVDKITSHTYNYYKKETKRLNKVLNIIDDTIKIIKKWEKENKTSLPETKSPLSPLL